VQCAVLVMRWWRLLARPRVLRGPPLALRSATCPRLRGALGTLGMASSLIGVAAALSPAIATAETPSGGAALTLPTDLSGLDQTVRSRCSAINAQLSRALGAAFSPLSLSSELLLPRSVTVAQPSAIVAAIEHTLLKPQASTKEIDGLTQEAFATGFSGVCVNSCNVAFARACLDRLQHADPARKPRPRLVSVVGFPLGAMHSKSKASEAADAIAEGAEELDMVINIGRLKEKDFVSVYSDIRGLVSVAHAHQVPVKVILETCLLSPEEIIDGCLLSRMAGADFVKTSTGFSTGGATVDAVQLMATVSTAGVVGAPPVQVKASGGIKTFADALSLMRAGATRLGTSSGVAIAEQARAVSAGAQPPFTGAAGGSALASTTSAPRSSY